MARIRHIAIHHSGGTQSNRFASSRNITWQQINAYHRDKWYFKSEIIPNSFGGYNLFYSPVTRKVHQFRAIGEETAAQWGHNFDTISLCIGGNYTKGSPDHLTEQNIEDIGAILGALLTGTHHWHIKRGTEIDLSPQRIRPHRHFQSSTECYGNGLSDGFFLSSLIRRYYKWTGWHPILLAMLRFRMYLDKPGKEPLGLALDRSCIPLLPDNI